MKAARTILAASDLCGNWAICLMAMTINMDLRIGFNLKITHMQAALGLSQLSKLDSFVATEEEIIIEGGLAHLQDKLILPEPTPGAEPSWFGFLITVKKEAGMDKDICQTHQK